MEPTAFSASPDRTWTLFLDRDGVINDEIVGSYVTDWSEFHFMNGALHAVSLLAGMFGRIVVVTNQRGVGRGIMSAEALRDITTRMTEHIFSAGGRVDQVYACTALTDDDRNRKPNTGMGMQAREDFPEINFRRSVMVGNSISDMEFGKRLGMNTVFLTTKHAPFSLPHDLIDEQYDSLRAFAESLKPAALEAA